MSEHTVTNKLSHSQTFATSEPKQYIAGLFLNPSRHNLKFEHKHRAEQLCREMARGSDAWSVRDEKDNTLYLYYDGIEFDVRST